MKALDISGQRFGRLIAIEPTKKRTDYGCVIWKCVCDCGTEKECSTRVLVSGTTRSCGCFRNELNIGNKYGLKHGLDGSLAYRSWASMKQRCLNPVYPGYKYYGGRGITICDRWLVFTNFYEDMKERPGKDYELDRIDPNGNYEPANCRWKLRWTGKQRNHKSKRARL